MRLRLGVTLAALALIAGVTAGAAASLDVAAAPTGAWELSYDGPHHEPPAPCGADGAAPCPPPADACVQPAVTVAGVIESTNTQVTLHLTGGGEPSRDCKDVSHISVGICGNPELVAGRPKGGGDVVATSQPDGWRYTPNRGQQLIKWDAPPSAGSGPWDLTFTYVLAGVGHPSASVTATVKRGQDLATSTLQLPQPAACL